MKYKQYEKKKNTLVNVPATMRGHTSGTGIQNG